MGHWGWRPLVLCFVISVWVVGCSDQDDTLPTSQPTDSPPVTLTLRPSPDAVVTELPGLPTRITRVVPTRVEETHPAASIVKTPTPLPITTQSPICYEAFNGAITCLGSITNTTGSPIEHILLRADIYRPDGKPLETQVITLPQRVLPPGERAPYRAIFAPDAGEFGGVQATLLRADPTEAPADVLRFDRVRTEPDGVQVVVSGDLINVGDAELPAVRVVVTLYDEEGRVAGFRVREYGRLPAGEARRIRFIIHPWFQSDALHLNLYAEARP